MEADTSLVVIGFHKKYCHPDAWKTATTRPKSATAYWLKKLGAEPVDFLPPRSGGTDGVEVVARCQKDNFEKVLRENGEFDVFSRPFFVKGDARVYKDVPLPVEFDLQAAMRKAKAVGPSILGVVLRGQGLGLRMKECDFESVVGQVYSELESKRFIGQRCRLPTEDCSTILGVRLSGPRNHANVKMRRSWCGQNQEKPQRKVKRLRNLGRVWSEETPRHQ